MQSGEFRKNGNGVGHKKAMFNGSKVLEVPREGAAVQFEQMIEYAPLNFIFADEDLVIRYMNTSSLKTLRTLQAYLPVPVDEIVGQSIDIFHKEPSHQRRLLADHRRLPHKALIPLGPETLELMVAGIENSETGKTGFMVTWAVVTDKVRLEREAARVSSMMENAPINVIFADRDLKIQYMNPASLTTLRKLQQHLPVRADDVVGQSIDVFHKNPAHQRRMLADHNNLPHRATIKLGPESLDLLVSPIFDGNRAYIGAMVTWEVITERLAAAQREKDMQERERLQAEELRKKVDDILKVVEAAAKGDLTQAVPVSGSDAIGQLGDGLGRFFSTLRTSIGEMSQSAVKLSKSSDGLTAVSQQLSANAEETSTQANVVSAASEQVSRNVQSVATASEEMGASIREIAKNANEAAKIATSAVKVATTTNVTVEKLGESSNEIGKVIKVITSIAQQTNLLALNATIEAARAGEAGKGFAVVANEVKELAKETARATEEIGQKIEAIQRDTRGAVEAISQIGSIIGQINDIQAAIATAVEEQTATANEIGRNVTEAAKGASEIAGNISGVAEAARSTTEGASDAQKAASGLADMAAGLQRLVRQFRIEA